MQAAGSSNFAHLQAHDEQLVRLGLLAERYFADDPNTCLLKLRQLTELLAQLAASRVGLFTTPDEQQADLLRRLQDQGDEPAVVARLGPCEMNAAVTGLRALIDLLREDPDLPLEELLPGDDATVEAAA